jgi:CHAT domain-containing protein
MLGQIYSAKRLYQEGIHYFNKSAEYSKNSIPFEALLYSKPARSNTPYNQLSYLITQYSISYHYSTTLWLHTMKSVQDQQQNYQNSFVGFAPIYNNTATVTPPRIAVGMRSGNTNNYATLIHSEKEVSVVEQLFKHHTLQSQLFLHQEATKKSFKQAISSSKYVLFAGHGFYDKEQPEWSGIVFSPNKDSDKSDVLSVQESYTLRTTVDLLVLSCCESGVGKHIEGEGNLSIVRGFLYAGAKNIVCSLFKVYDKSSSELSQYFFNELTQHSNYATALQMAKKQLIASNTSTPKLWSGLILIGK